ncbi:MAG: hypothetical protein RI924_1401 [Bacteroidota bacterium]|jgi:hypothetical protein
MNKKQLVILFALSALLMSSAVAQDKKNADTLVIVTSSDSSKTSIGKKGTTIIQIGNLKINTNDQKTSIVKANAVEKRTVSVGFVFDHVDLGFSRYLDNGSFTLSPENSFLEFQPSKTTNFAFDFFEFKYKSSPSFSIYLAAGLDWNHIRLVNNVTIQKNQSQLTAVQENVNFSKNRFSSRYLRLPIGFEFSHKVQNGKYLRFVAGPELGFLLNGKVKQISKERGKEKFKDDYNFNPFRMGAHARLGYQNTGIFAKYYFNEVFAKGQGPEDFRNLSFGFTWGF